MHCLATIDNAADRRQTDRAMGKGAYAIASAAQKLLFFSFIRVFPILKHGPSAIVCPSFVVVAHHKLSGSNISRTVRPRIIEFYRDIHANPFHSNTGLAFIEVRKAAEVPPPTAMGRIVAFRPLLPASRLPVGLRKVNCVQTVRDRLRSRTNKNVESRVRD